MTLRDCCAELRESYRIGCSYARKSVVAPDERQAQRIRCTRKRAIDERSRGRRAVRASSKRGKSEKRSSDNRVVIRCPADFQRAAEIGARSTQLEAGQFCAAANEQ